MVLERLVQRRVIGQPIPEMLEFVARGKPAADKQKRRLRERRMLSDLLDWNAAIAEDALLTVNKRDLARAGARVAVSRIDRDKARAVPQLRDVNGKLSLSPFDDRHFDRSAIERQRRVACHRLCLPASPALQAVK